jgi:two-component system sensor histidine kinase PilS (NtrC family)
MSAVPGSAAPPASPFQFFSVRVPESFWVSLGYFNLYRFAVAAVFLGTALAYHDELTIGQHNLPIFLTVCAVYLGTAGAFQAGIRLWRDRFSFNLQLTVHAFVDIVAITLLMFASGGMRSGLGVMLLVSITGTSLLAPRRLTFLYAALAAIAALLEQSYWVLLHDAPTGSFLQPGLLSIGYFVTAGITGQLAQRLVANEELARRRGQELRSQMRVNQLVIGDMQDGVLVLDRDARVVQANPQGARLLGLEPLVGADLAEALPEAALRWANWRRDRAQRPAGLAPAVYDAAVRGRDLRVRFIDTGTEEGFTVVFVEDVTRSREQARQLKLAALGRLTANIAHEIRNPLSAISHAAELLAEGQGPGPDQGHGPGEADRLRLTRIINDNTRRLERLVSDVLQLNRRDRIEAERLALHTYMKGFLEEFVRNQALPAERIVLEPGREAWVNFDRGHLHQVLWNLLTNATRHASTRGAAVRVTLRVVANQVELNVIDDGSGVEEAHQAQLFEPFFTTYSAGTGLGLYLARELCAANRAVLEYVDDMPGAHFRIVCEESAPAAPGAEGAAP